MESNQQRNAAPSAFTFAKLLELWESPKTSQNVRKWIMSEFEERDPLTYSAWIYGYYGYGLESARNAFGRNARLERE